MATYAQLCAGFFQSERAHFAVRQVTGGAFAFLGRLVRELSAISFGIMTFKTVLLLAESRSAFDLRFRVRVIPQQEQPQHGDECQQNQLMQYASIQEATLLASAIVDRVMILVSVRSRNLQSLQCGFVYRNLRLGPQFGERRLNRG